MNHYYDSEEYDLCCDYVASIQRIDIVKITLKQKDKLFRIMTENTKHISF